MLWAAQDQLVDQHVLPEFRVPASVAKPAHAELSRNILGATDANDFALALDEVIGAADSWLDGHAIHFSFDESALRPVLDAEAVRASRDLMRLRDLLLMSPPAPQAVPRKYREILFDPRIVPEARIRLCTALEALAIAVVLGHAQRTNLACPSWLAKELASHLERGVAAIDEFVAAARASKRQPRT